MTTFIYASEWHVRIPNRQSGKLIHPHSKLSFVIAVYEKESDAWEHYNNKQAKGIALEKPRQHFYSFENHRNNWK